MNNSTLFKKGFLHAFAVFIYIFLLVFFVNNINNWFGTNDQGIVAPIAALMLFVFSALITSSFVLAEPIMLYIDKKKKEAIKLLFFTGLGLGILLFIIFLILLILNKNII